MKTIKLYKIPFLVTVFLVIFVAEISAQNKRDLVFDDIFTFPYPKIPQAFSWMKEDIYYSVLERNRNDIQEIRKYNITNGTYQVMLRQSQLQVEGKTLEIDDYALSEDEKLFLIKTDVESIWRRSTREHYYVYNTNTNALIKVGIGDTKIQYAAFSPDGRKVGFVRDNNIYYFDLQTQREYAVTTDGKVNYIINGVADWVYEEEFSFSKAWHWSPDGQKIAFYRFDESEVKQYTLQYWLNNSSAYPNDFHYKYPKTGEKNAIISLHIYDLDDNNIRNVNLGEEEFYVPRIKWLPNSRYLAILRMPRHQNRLHILLSDVNGNVRTIFVDESNTWIDIDDDVVTFIKNGTQLIYMADRDGYRHLYLYDLNGTIVNQITRGSWDVTAFYGYDERSQTLYYQSSEISPMERHIYSIKIDARQKTKLSKIAGWHEANFNSNYSYYVDTYSNSTTPHVTKVYTSRGQELRTIEDNQNLLAQLNDVNMPQKEYMNLNIHNAGVLNAYMIRPPRFNPSQKYPVLFYVYGGPGSQTVTNRYEYGQRPMWHNYLASQGYIIFSVDNRGTGGRGADFMKQVYLKLGQLEVEDQIAAAKWLKDTYSYIDPNRIGIWGWSYGGYMSTLALAQGSDDFSTAIAVAPVSLWNFYDTIYTERYMRTPKENPQGYMQGSPLTYANKINGKYLLIHGTGDDNVHFQNAVYLVEELVRSNIQFQSFYYPDRNHGIGGNNARPHLFRMMTDFVFNNL